MGTQRRQQLKAKFIEFGKVEIDGTSYTDDLVITGGEIAPRDKTPSKRYRARYDHTPLSAQEVIPWECKRLIIGTGAEGRLPVMKKVYKQAAEHGVQLIAVSTPEACRLLSEADLSDTNAILHITC
jgi:hypothetical protein